MVLKRKEEEKMSQVEGLRLIVQDHEEGKTEAPAPYFDVGLLVSDNGVEHPGATAIVNKIPSVEYPTPYLFNDAAELVAYRAAVAVFDPHFPPPTDRPKITDVLIAEIITILHCERDVKELPMKSEQEIKDFLEQYRGKNLSIDLT